MYELGTPEGLPGVALAIFVRNGDFFVAGQVGSGFDYFGGYWRHGLFYKIEDAMIVRDIVTTPY